MVSILVDSGSLSMWGLMRARDPHGYDAEVYARLAPIEPKVRIADEMYALW